jgi:serine/threonine protein kinase
MSMAMGDALVAQAHTCLDEQQVLDFVGGHLAGDGLTTVEQHVAHCDDCTVLIGRIATDMQPHVQPTTPADADDLDSDPDTAGPTGDGHSEPSATTSAREQPPSLQAGTILRDTYRIIRPIEKGGMGEVYEASHARLAGRYAVKVLPPEFASNKQMLARFRREAQIASGLQHPNIVQVIDFHETAEGRPYLVMEYLDGEDLAKLMFRHGPFTLPEVLPIVEQIAAALDAVHRKGVVHRDIKPQNVFIVPQPSGKAVVKLLDFGISKASAAGSVVTRQPILMGTPQYMAPEQVLRRADDIGPATDQFAMASIIYEMLTARPTFEGPMVSVLLYQIAHEPPPLVGIEAFERVEPVLRRALSKITTDRYPSMTAFVSALAATLAPVAAPPLPVVATPVAPLPIAPPNAGMRGDETAHVSSAPPLRPQRRLVLAAIAGVSLAVVATIALVVARQNTAAPPSAADTRPSVAAPSASRAAPPPMETPRPPTATVAPVENAHVANPPVAAARPVITDGKQPRNRQAARRLSLSTASPPPVPAHADVVPAAPPQVSTTPPSTPPPPARRPAQMLLEDL